MASLLSLLDNRIPLAQLPTPVQPYPKLSEWLGVELYVKRDDLTESVISGNKIRKIEYLLWEAKQLEADTLITCGGVQSNHCRAVAAVAARHGLGCLLLLRGEPPADMSGNLLVDSILGAECRFFSREQFARLGEIEEAVCQELREKGRSPYVIPMGGSNATGSLGYVRMVKELKEQGQAWDHLHCALGSGGTFAGIWLGCGLYDMEGKPHGVAVCDDVDYFIGELERIRREFKAQYDLEADFEGAGPFMDGQHVGLGYGLNTEEELSQLVRIARMEGLVLDPVYTLKTFLGLVDDVRSGKVAKGSRVLFVHTGGHYGLFPKNTEFEPVLGRKG